MRILLDTHTLLWLATEPARLSPAARSLLEDQETEVVVSAIAAYEIGMKHELGRLPEAAPLMAGYPRVLEAYGARELAVTSAHCLVAARLPRHHRDPFDRILAAQALVELMPVLGVDAQISNLGARRIW